jgi:hypothetical protein
MHAVIVVNDKYDEDPENIMMTDNGTAGNLNIPSFLIKKSDGEILK